MIFRKKHQDVYDLESYPNFFSAVYKNIVTKEIRTFIAFYDTEDDTRSINEMPLMIDFLEKEVEWLIGYNNQEYDNILLKYLTNDASRLRSCHPKKITAELFQINKTIFNTKRGDQKTALVYALQKIPVTWKSLDLQQLFNPVDIVGLKRLAISLRWPLIQDLPIKPGSTILHSEIEKMMVYNINDVNMTERVKDELAENINNRIAYTVKYGTNIINSSNSAIGKQLMADIYEKNTGIPYNNFKNLETNYNSINLAECIAPNIHFISRNYNKILEKIQNQVVDPNYEETLKEINKERRSKNRNPLPLKPQFELKLSSKYVQHAIKLGGMHSEGPAEILEETKDYIYIDIDVEGFYPRIIDKQRLHPAHLLPEWTDIFVENIVNNRQKIKKTEPVLSYILKIGANAAFGLMDVKKNIRSWLKDPKVAKTITISGQLYLAMLMEGLELYSKCLVVYSNTDGLTVRVPVGEKDLFYKICYHWEIYTGFKLEYIQYRKMIIRDVNNYLMFSYDKEKPIKAKGAYVFENTMSTDLKVKGFAYPVIAMAVREHYDKGTPVDLFILNHKPAGWHPIYDFMKAQNTNVDKYDVVIVYADMNRPPTFLQKHNRWIVTTGNIKEGRLIKINKYNNKRSEMQKGVKVTSLNDVDESVPIEDYKLNYSFYIKQANALIDLTKSLDKETHIQDMKQTTLFE